MKPLPVQNYYEVLEVSRDASGDEIERAYRLARITYVNDSLAGYSVFAEGDAATIRERVETAYRVLSDRETRRAYDATLKDAAEVGPAGQAAALPAAEPPAAPAAALEDPDGESGDFDGDRLRRARLRRGLGLDEVAGITKISPAYLRSLEEERFADLPARVYVRGFVSAYASCLGLDPGRAANGYMRRLESALGSQRSSSLFESLR